MNTKKEIIAAVEAQIEEEGSAIVCFDGNTKVPNFSVQPSV
jgi:hypothetical protein